MAEANKENIGGNLPDHSQWMTNLPEELQRVPLNNLAIPGR